MVHDIKKKAIKAFNTPRNNSPVSRAELMPKAWKLLIKRYGVNLPPVNETKAPFKILKGHPIRQPKATSIARYSFWKRCIQAFKYLQHPIKDYLRRRKAMKAFLAELPPLESYETRFARWASKNR